MIPTVSALEFMAINDTLSRFFLAFDERNWQQMSDCLAPQLHIDYASSGREQPSRMSNQEFVQRRQNAVDNLSKHHSFSNLLLSKNAAGINARCNYLILRFDSTAREDGDDFFHSCGAYEFVFSEVDGQLKIASITQRALRSWGNRQLHGGSRKS
ncbi:nuclear transport factor 2 family protein [Pseudomonas sp.]|uniref:nuclear transport factor 2 family protein n=1 Tax=Pseudomonas sp. TaxID=306 RepID=UPI003A97476C